MKYLMILVLSCLTFIAYSEDFPIMLNVKSDIKIPDDFRDGVEESLTTMGYSLVDDKAQKEALKENAKARNSECYDDECLVDTGKMLAARALISVEVDKKSDKLYKFKARYIDFETGTTTKSKVMYYEAELNDYQALSKFGKEFTKLLLGGKTSRDEAMTHPATSKVTHPTTSKATHPTTSKATHPATSKATHPATSKATHPTTSKVTHPATSKATSKDINKNNNKDKPKEQFIKKDTKNKPKISPTKKEKKITNLLLKSKRYANDFDITISLHGGRNAFFKESNNDKGKFEEDLDLSWGALGFGFGLTYHLNPWLGFYIDANYTESSGTGNRDFINHENSNLRESYDIRELSSNSLFISLGGMFSFGDITGKGLVYYLKTAFSFGRDSFQHSIPDNAPDEEKEADLKYWDAYKTTSVGFSLEAGINILFNRDNGIDLYALLYYGKVVNDDLSAEPHFLKLKKGETIKFLLGIRYNVFSF